MAHLHADMEGVDFHVALEVCEIVIKSVTLVPIGQVQSRLVPNLRWLRCAGLQRSKHHVRP
ncbi:MAG: hypothetical protein DME88_09860 [Verrucomicrobia bacterium]|nr:MAG: hypothetical protein DME88_09860 [Verrucomicrobiota bacterium]